MSTIITVAAIVAVFLLLGLSAAGLFGSREQQRVDDDSAKTPRVQRIEGD